MSQFVDETPDAEHYFEQLQTRGEWGFGVPLSSFSLALENSRTVKSGQGRLFGIAGTSTRGTSQFILIFDKATPVANGDVPVMVLTVAASSNFGVYYGDVGRWFTRGIQLANSSTSATLTLGSADTWFDAQYI